MVLLRGIFLVQQNMTPWWHYQVMRYDYIPTRITRKISRLKRENARRWSPPVKHSLPVQRWPIQMELPSQLLKACMRKSIMHK